MKKQFLILACSVLALTACKNENKEKEEEKSPNENKEMAQENNENNEWISLFNGKNLEGWKVYGKDSISDQWQVKDGAIVFVPSEKEKSAENLITKEQFTSFELSLDWKISEGGNSGVMYAVQDNPEKYSEPYMTGPEIQILDNQRHPDAKNGPNRTAGALYDLYPPSKDVTKPAGEWNHEVIRIDHENNQGSVTLNGTKIVEFPAHGPDWDKQVENSKFKDWEGFGKNRTGHIALQDHGHKVWFKDIKIKPLD
ncbi:DUF1080 domain-containing protein [Christiangramia fulva]|uniref:DUF1080 domain-containing protein n=1 Tax=Christiangramia fulva TaxID=2126553 RepID=A0A2R3Z760_9FLAO|nr:DUF1080 domain-containing protein [Christiangramia fulva]AVR46111.1 DUF1080 domain-containing protein [Christiangramia fulva]